MCFAYIRASRLCSLAFSSKCGTVVPSFSLPSPCATLVSLPSPGATLVSPSSRRPSIMSVVDRCRTCFTLQPSSGIAGTCLTNSTKIK